MTVQLLERPNRKKKAAARNRRTENKQQVKRQTFRFSFYSSGVVLEALFKARLMTRSREHKSFTDPTIKSATVRQRKLRKSLPARIAQKLEEMKEGLGPGFLSLENLGPAPWFNDTVANYEPLTNDNLFDHPLTSSRFNGIDGLNIGILELLGCVHEPKDGDQRWFRDLLWDDQKAKTGHNTGDDLPLYPRQVDSHLDLPVKDAEDPMAKFVALYGMLNQTGESVFLLPVQRVGERLLRQCPQAVTALALGNYVKEDDWDGRNHQPKATRNGRAILKNIGTDEAPDFRMAFDENRLRVPESVDAETREAVGFLVNAINAEIKDAIEVKLDRRGLLLVDNSRFLIFRKELPFSRFDLTSLRKPTHWRHNTRWFRFYKGYSKS